MPHSNQSKIIDDWKMGLENNFGWFNSCNSKAHNTVAEFWDEKELLYYLPRIKTFCNLVIPKEVTFNDFIFGNKTFLILPDRSSKIYLSEIIKNLHLHIGKKNPGISAHISIARGLNSEKMNVAKKLFENTSVNFKFICDALYLRKFDAQTKQYSDIIEKLELKGKAQPDLFTF